MNQKENLLNLTPADAAESLRRFAAEMGQPAYRAAQVARHLWQVPLPGFEAMTNIPLGFRQQLAGHFDIPRLELATRQISADGTTA